MIEAGAAAIRWPRILPRRLPTAVALAALLAGLAVGFLGGLLTESVRSPTAVPTPGTAAEVSPAITVTGSWCAVQHGRALQLGIEILNQSRRAAALSAVRPLLPLGGMAATASAWATCGAPPGAGQGQAAALGPGTTAWLTVTFRVMVPCPAALPVGFRVRYTQSGRPATADFRSFPDLGQVPYAGCHAHQQAARTPAARQSARRAGPGRARSRRVPFDHLNAAGRNQPAQLG